MSFAFSDIPDQTGRVAVVTGANSGIGFQIARHLALKGARVLLACRDTEKGGEALDRIAWDAPGADLSMVELDLANLESVHFAARAIGEERQLDLLVNNAGLSMPPLGRGIAGTELQFSVNYLGHFALTGLLLGKLAADGGGRVVCQSSNDHCRGKIDFDNLDAHQGYERRKFYAQSKLAILLFALELDRRLRAANSPVASLASHPGVAATELLRHLGPLQMLKPVFRTVFNDAEHGALPALQAATDPQAEGGVYFGPWGLMEMRGKTSGRAVVTEPARDAEVARKLWEKSVELTGINPRH